MDIFLRRNYLGFEKLDAGGQGNVYKTSKNGKEFAIKVVHIEEPNNPKLDDDLKRELQIVRNLKHPNCIHVEELFRTKSKIYIVMDLMPNGNIGSFVRKFGPLDEWKARWWFCPVARAIKYCHAYKIAHRDLKLDNILLDRHFNPMVTDFGFSRFVHVDASTGKVSMSDTYCGTTSHNPPEILMKRLYDPFKGDIWCLGVMLFIMLNQEYPFDRRDGKDKMYESQMKRGYKLKSSIEATLSVEVKQLMDTLLEPFADKRPSIQDVCKHPWFPLILSENEILTAAASKPPSDTSVLPPREGSGGSDGSK